MTQQSEIKNSSIASSRLGVFALKFVLLIVGFGAIYFTSGFVEKNRTGLPDAYEDSDLALQGKRLKGFSLGAEGLLADWYWIGSLQYIGAKIVKSDITKIDIEDLTPLNPRLLYPLLDNATDLDPKFMAAYSYGAIVLPAIDPTLAVKLTEKGIANNPDVWRLYQYLGYIHWRIKDYEKAAETYEKGSRIAGAPDFMREMAASMKTHGGSRETAREMYSQMLAEAEDQQSKANAELRLMQLVSLDERDAVDQILAEFQNKNGRCPNRVAEIFPSLRTVKLPRGRQFLIDAQNNLADPTGSPYRINENECKLALDPDSKIPKN